MDKKVLSDLLHIRQMATKGLWHSEDNDSDDYHLRVIRFPSEGELLGVIKPQSGEKIATVFDNDGRNGGGCGEDAEAIVSSMNNLPEVIKSHLKLYDDYESLYRRHELLFRENIKVSKENKRLKKLLDNHKARLSKLLVEVE